MELGTSIPDKLFFRIGEVCELIRVQPHVLRYWETEFPMLTPQKNRAGQRVYRRKDVEMVMRIRNLLYEEKFTIAGAKRKLMEETRGPARARPVSREASQPEVDPPVAEPLAPPPARHAVEAADPDPQVTKMSEVTERVDTVAAQAAGQSLSPQARRALLLIKRELEDLLTRLNTDVSIKA